MQMDVSMPFGRYGRYGAHPVVPDAQGLPAQPIIALTAHAKIGDRERCLPSAMDDHITKQLRHGDLLDAINKLAGGGKKEQHHLMKRPPEVSITPD